MRRRTLLELLATAGFAGVPACAKNEKKHVSQTSSPLASKQEAPPPGSASPMPVLFLAHGAPILMDDPSWVGELSALAGTLPRPRSILMLSAHWEKRPATFGATQTVPLYYDFYGFPERYFQVKYPAPGAPELASRVGALLGARGLPVARSERGLDHGAYVPLLCMYPEANVPVLQLSLPSLEPKELFALGQTLAPLRNEGVLVIGSGFLTHNMRYAFRHETPDWAVEFDTWAADALARRDHDALIDFQNRGPAAHVALPTTEHFVPVLVAAGASADRSESVEFPITGFWGAGGGAFTRRSVRFG
jgi:4,5-DOPA dioxygenase extradiol